MDNLSEIVKLINAVLLTKAFNVESRQKSALFGIAKLLPYKLGDAGYETIPTEVNFAGQWKKLFPDDINPIQIYHKVNSIASVPEKQQYGNTNERIICTSQNSMIIWAQSDKIKMMDIQLDELILSVFPSKISGDDLTRLELTGCSITYNSTDFNSMQIFAREYATKKYYLKPEHLFFEVKYSIECRLNRNCIKTC